jgi:hypothetical protein
VRGSWRLSEDVEGAGARVTAPSINRPGDGRVAS